MLYFFRIEQPTIRSSSTVQKPRYRNYVSWNTRLSFLAITTSVIMFSLPFFNSMRGWFLALPMALIASMGFSPWLGWHSYFYEGSILVGILYVLFYQIIKKSGTRVPPAAILWIYISLLIVTGFLLPLYQ